MATFQKHERLGGRDRFMFYNTMSGLLKGLENRYTLIDLRNESCIYGKIIYVEGNMNIQMENAVFCDCRGQQFSFKQFFVNHRNIRYVHIPKGSTATEIMTEQINKLHGVINRQKKVVQGEERTFKKKRAQMKHDATVHELGKTEIAGPSTEK